jgi:hypothetical protein
MVMLIKYFIIIIIIIATRGFQKDKGNFFFHGSTTMIGIQTWFFD